jgi:hypothetical protein
LAAIPVTIGDECIPSSNEHIATPPSSTTMQWRASPLATALSGEEVLLTLVHFNTGMKKFSAVQETPLFVDFNKILLPPTTQTSPVDAHDRARRVPALPNGTGALSQV